MHKQEKFTKIIGYIVYEWFSKSLKIKFHIVAITNLTLERRI